MKTGMPGRAGDPGRTAARRLLLTLGALLASCPATPTPGTCQSDDQCPTGFRCLGSPPTCARAALALDAASADALAADAPGLDAAARDLTQPDLPRPDAPGADASASERPLLDTAVADAAAADQARLDAPTSSDLAAPDLWLADLRPLESSLVEVGAPDQASPDLGPDDRASADLAPGTDLHRPDLASAADQATAVDAVLAGPQHVASVLASGTGPLAMTLDQAQSGDLALFAVAYEAPGESTTLSVSGLCPSMVDVYDEGPADLPMRQFWCRVDLTQASAQVAASLRTDSQDQLPILLAVSLYRGAREDPLKSTSGSGAMAEPLLTYGSDASVALAAGDRLYGVLYARASSHAAVSPTQELDVTVHNMASGRPNLLAVVERAVGTPGLDSTLDGSLGSAQGDIAFYLRILRLR